MVTKAREIIVAVTAFLSVIVSCYIGFMGIIFIDFVYIAIGILLLYTNFKGLIGVVKHRSRDIKIYVLGNILLTLLFLLLFFSAPTVPEMFIDNYYFLFPVFLLIVSTYCAVTIKFPLPPIIDVAPTEENVIEQPPKYEDAANIESTYEDLPPPYVVTALAMPETRTVPLTTTQNEPVVASPQNIPQSENNLTITDTSRITTTTTTTATTTEQSINNT